MDTTFDLITVKIPENIAPYATYVRALDRFSDHASELSGVLLLIAHRNKEAKRAGLGGDDSFKEIAVLVKDYFYACRPAAVPSAAERQNPANVREEIHAVLTGYQADAVNVEYFDQWLTGYGLNAVDLAAAEEKLESVNNG